MGPPQRSLAARNRVHALSGWACRHVLSARKHNASESSDRGLKRLHGRPGKQLGVGWGATHFRLVFSACPDMANPWWTRLVMFYLRAECASCHMTHSTPACIRCPLGCLCCLLPKKNSQKRKKIEKPCTPVQRQKKNQKIKGKKKPEKQKQKKTFPPRWWGRRFAGGTTGKLGTQGV